jgi:hypothetical protein
MQVKRSDIDDLGPGDANRQEPLGARRDETDYEHRHFVNLLAVAFLLIIAGAIIWTVRAIDDNERLQRCINAGRRDCVQIETPSSSAVRLPVR